MILFQFTGGSGNYSMVSMKNEINGKHTQKTTVEVVEKKRPSQRARTGRGREANTMQAQVAAGNVGQILGLAGR